MAEERLGTLVLHEVPDREVHACDDCRHVDYDRRNVSWCEAFGGIRCDEVRAPGDRVRLRCAGFERAPSPQPMGLLRRLWRWLW